MKKPTSIDPWDFNQNMDIKAYIELEEKMKELTNYSEVKQDIDLKEVFK